MKRIFATLGLVQLFLLFSFVPIADAGTMQLGVCNFGKFGVTGNATTQTGNDLETEIQNMQVIMEGVYSDGTYKAGTCGASNSSTGMVEKSDCTTQVISEISEVVSSATPTTETGEDKIVNLYHGVCCLIYNSTGTCYETRTFYTATYPECLAIASGTVSNGLTKSNPNCELRQWIIASTGMGLLKLYVKQIFTFGAFAVGAVAVATIILNGVRISVAGVSGDISEAKQKITQSLSGIVLLFLAALILYSINPDFFG